MVFSLYSTIKMMHGPINIRFARGPSRNPAKHVPGRVPELEKKTAGSGASTVEGSTVKETSLMDL